MMSLQFGRELSSVLTEVIPILKGELQVINTDPHNNKKRKALFMSLLHKRDNVGSPWHYLKPTMDNYYTKKI